MKIPQEIIDELISQAQQDAPNETCGYLLGTSSPEGDVVTEYYWMENIDHSPEHFSFAPKDQFTALRYARSKGLNAILSLHEGVHLNSFKIQNGEVVNKEVHL